MLYRSTRFFWVLVAFLAFCAHPAWGQQSTTAQITGLVTDATGASVPGAAVVAINTATNVEYPTETNVAGVYVLPNILPGPYTVTVSIQGFKTQVRTDLAVRVADRLGINFVLEPGEIRTTVEITATVEGINTSDARLLRRGGQPNGHRPAPALTQHAAPPRQGNSGRAG